MNLEPFSRAVLQRDLPESSLRRGDVGTVVEIYRDSAGAIVGYELELFSAAGDTIAIVSVPAEAVRSPAPTDRLASRVA